MPEAAEGLSRVLAIDEAQFCAFTLHRIEVYRMASWFVAAYLAHKKIQIGCRCGVADLVLHDGHA